MQNMASSWDDLGQPSAWGCWFPIEEVPSDGRRGQESSLHFEDLLCTVRIAIVMTRGEDGMAQQDEDIVRSGGAAYDRRRFLRQAGFGAAGIAGGVLLGAGASSASPLTSRLAGRAGSSLPPGLVTAAQQEGQINLIALPDNWANHGTQA